MSGQALASVSLARLAGGDSQGTAGRPLGRLYGVSCVLQPGVTAVIGDASDGTLALCELCSGRARPRRGAVLVHGRQPHHSSLARRHIGVLDWRPSPLPGATVGAALQCVGRLRGVELDGALGAVSAGRLAAARCAELTGDERRCVELAVALALPQPWLLTLYEPFVAVGGIDIRAVHQRLRALAEAGTVVLVAVRSADDVAGLATRTLVLEQGLVREGAPGEGSPVAGAGLLVRFAPAHHAQARELAAALASRAALWEVAWRDEGSAGAWVLVRADSLEVAATVVAEQVAADRITVAAVHPTAPCPTRGGAHATQWLAPAVAGGGASPAATPAEDQPIARAARGEGER